MNEKKYMVCWFDSDSGVDMWAVLSKDELLTFEFDEHAEPIVFDMDSKIHWLKVV